MPQGGCSAAVSRQQINLSFLSPAEARRKEDWVVWPVLPCFIFHSMKHFQLNERLSCGGRKEINQINLISFIYENEDWLIDFPSLSLPLPFNSTQLMKLIGCVAFFSLLQFSSFFFHQMKQGGIHLIGVKKRSWIVFMVGYGRRPSSAAPFHCGALHSSIAAALLILTQLKREEEIN